MGDFGIALAGNAIDASSYFNTSYTITTDATSGYVTLAYPDMQPWGSAPVAKAAPADKRSKNERWLDKRVDEIRVSL